MMVVGLNYRTAPVEIRERVSVPELELDDFLAELRNSRTILESVVVSTCNRTEVYAVVNSDRAGEDYLRTLFHRRAQISASTLDKHLFVMRGENAVTHLMRVACGLDSMVIGETQILGQVRSAFLLAADGGNTGALLNQLFRRVIQLGKRAQTETTIGQSPVSVSYAAVQLAKKIFGELTGRRVLVIGAGKMSKLTAQHLHAAGIAELCVVNRTYDKAVQLAAEFGGSAVPWTDLERALATSDIVISSTGSKDIVLSSEMVERAWKARNRKPIALIDIAVPRDIEALSSSLRNVYLYDIDDLQGVVDANLAERKRQAVEVERMIRDTFEEYNTWLSEQEVVPLVRAVRAKGLAIQASVMESLQRKLPNLSERELELIHKHTMSIVNQLLREPVQNMKELSIAAGGVQHVRVFAELFGVTAEMMHEQGTSFWQDASIEEETPAIVGFNDLVKQWGEALLREHGAPKASKSALHPVLR